MKSNRSFGCFRAKDPVLAVLLALGMTVTLPALVRAQVATNWEEVGPSGQAQQLMSAPPAVSAYAGQVRPPVALPDSVEAEPMEEVPENEINEAPEDSDVSADAGFYNNPGGTYTIQKGDTLGKIAKRMLGSSQKWKDIAAANPHVNPNKLNIGETIIIPGSQAGYSETTYTQPNFVSAPPVVSSNQSHMKSAAASRANSNAMNGYSVPSYGIQEPASAQMVYNAESIYQPNVQQAPAAVSAPSFDPPPLLAPPPVPDYNMPNYSAPTYNSSGMPVYSAPPVPPAPPAPAVTIPPDTSYDAPIYQAPTAPSNVPYTAGVVFNAGNADGSPVGVSTRELYREERYRIPDELKPTDFLPYFNNMNGYYGLFEVETAMLPYIPTWDLSVGLRHSSYEYLNGEKGVIEGTEMYVPVSLSYAYRKLFFGATIPFQSWEVQRSGGANNVKLSGMHDPSLKFAYQVWKNLEGSHAITLHTEAKFSGGNYHSPFLNARGLDFEGKAKQGSVMGPAYSSRGTWMEIGGAYTGKTNEKWTNHLNFAVANDSKDSLLALKFRLGTDYRLNHNCSLVGELNGTRYETDNAMINAGKSGTNADLLLGVVLFNDQWQATLGFPISIQREFAYYYDFGITFGVNARWD